MLPTEKLTKLFQPLKEMKYIVLNPMTMIDYSISVNTKDFLYLKVYAIFGYSARIEFEPRDDRNV
jgi:hypothetical protein